MTKIHPSSYVDPQAKLGNDVEVGPFCVVHGNVEIGDRTIISAYCEIGLPTNLGNGSPLLLQADSLIRSHSIFYESSSFGPRLVTGHRVTVREHTVAGDCFQIGTLTEIQGDCEIGDHVRFQSGVFVGKKTKIGNFVWILPHVILANDPTPPSNTLLGCVIEDYASISAMAVILPGVNVGKGSLVAAHACVNRDVPAHMVVAGVPAHVIGEAESIKLRDGSNDSAYPWTQHFHRGYPDEVVKGWLTGIK
jgi:acyl-[acyl carrier protein]--UDP-N-acetylglucosamine O-acyltransferase